MEDRLKLDIPHKEVEEFCIRHGISRLSIFGSALTERFSDDSDVDILVEFPEGGSPGLLGLAKLEGELSDILGGRKVDIRTPHEISSYFREDVLSKARIEYAG